MAILGSSFSIGRSALTAYQASIAITGQNIANVANPDYTRQSGHLSTMAGGMTIAGVTPGMGVRVDGLQRHIDEALESRLRLALSQRNSAQTTYQTLNRVEVLYGELSEYDLSTQLSNLFTAFTNLQTDPAENTARDLVIHEADRVIHTIQRYRAGLVEGVEDLNDTAQSLARDANGIVDEIARLNEQIVAAGARGNGADGGLRDRRDALLRDLAELMEIQTRHQDNGVTNVYVGSEPLVEFNRSRGITVERVREDGLERTQVRFADNNGAVRLGTGQLGAITESRDVHLQQQLDQLDQLARGLIYEVNRVHSSGQGLRGYTSLLSTNTVSDATAALNSSAANLTYPVQNGAFFVRVRDANGGRAATGLIQVDLDGVTDPNLAGDSDTTLTSLAAALDAITGVTASVTVDNRLQIDVDDGYELTFADDSSGVLAALGIGTFFDGTDAATMALSADVAADPRLIATSRNGAPGDGSNAGRLAAVGEATSSLLGDLGVQEFHEDIINQLAVAAAGAQTDYEAHDAVYSGLLAQRESTSGVDLDEEAINLTMFERSFQGASRYLTVLDTLSGEVLSLVQ